MERIFLIILANLLCTGIKAQVYADGKGEVIATKDSATVKIWSMKDCKLIASMGNESPEWFARQLRHRFLYGTDPDELTRDFVLSDNEKEDSYRILRGQTEVGYITMPENALQSEDYCSANDMLLFRGINDGKATIWIFDPKVSTTKVKVLDKYKIDNDAYISPTWSPKGTYIVCPFSRKIWNTTTGKSVAIAGKYEPTGFYPHRFDLEEENVSIATKSGMTVVDLKTGKVIAEYAIPVQLKIGTDYEVTACSDGKSFLFNKGDKVFVNGTSGPYHTKVWLITEGKVACEFLY